MQDECLKRNLQPLFDAKAAKRMSFEAPVRWHYPTEKKSRRISSSRWPEETGLIVPLGDQSLCQSCTEAAK